jgi:hypothetical protein
MKLWVDDERPAPDGWVWAKTSDEAIAHLIHADGFDVPMDAMSLDHDLGGEDTTRPIVLWLCENDWWPERVYVHTANPVGREWLEGMVDRYGHGVSRW